MACHGFAGLPVIAFVTWLWAYVCFPNWLPWALETGPASACWILTWRWELDTRLAARQLAREAGRARRWQWSTWQWNLGAGTLEKLDLRGLDLDLAVETGHKTLESDI